MHDKMMSTFAVYFNFPPFFSGLGDFRTFPGVGDGRRYCPPLTPSFFRQGSSKGKGREGETQGGGGGGEKRPSYQPCSPLPRFEEEARKTFVSAVNKNFFIFAPPARPWCVRGKKEKQKRVSPFPTHPSLSCTDTQRRKEGQR